MKQNNQELLQKAYKNLKDSIKLQIINLKEVNLIETPHYMIYSIGVESTDAHLNGAICLNDDFAKEMMHKADKFFNKLNLDFSVWVNSEANAELEKLLINKGLTANRSPGSAVMHIDKKINDQDFNHSFQVKKVNCRKEIDDFGEVIKQAFSKTQHVIDKMFETDKTLLHKDIIAHIIYKNEKPLSAVMTVFSEDIAGIYWVGTLEKARGQGLGSLATQIATNIGFDHGKKQVILQASELGERVYKRLGYRTITRYRTYTIRKS